MRMFCTLALISLSLWTLAQPAYGQLRRSRQTQPAVHTPPVTYSQFAPQSVNHSPSSTAQVTPQPTVPLDVCVPTLVEIGGVWCSAELCTSWTGNTYLKNINCGQSSTCQTFVPDQPRRGLFGRCRARQAQTRVASPTYSCHCHTRGSCDQGCLERLAPACIAVCSVDPTGAACVACLGISWGTCCSKWLDCHCH